MHQQIAGKSCQICDQKIIFADDGTFCSKCWQVFCNACFDSENCVVCEANQSQQESPVTQPVFEKALNFAIEQLRNGKSYSQIRASLVEQGVDEETRSAVIKQLTQIQCDADKSAGSSNMLVGAACCIVGIALTALSYGSTAPGESYYVMWGLVVYGIFKFFKGLTQAAGDG